MFKQIMIAACLALPVAAYAADEPKKPNPQNTRMAACNKDAGEKKLSGDERKKFMSDCLSAEKKTQAAKAQPAKSQQDRMTICNKTAGEKALKGDDRKKFMKECLST